MPGALSTPSSNGGLDSLRASAESITGVSALLSERTAQAATGRTASTAGAALPRGGREVSGVALTKLDCTAKGGIAVAARELGPPVKLVSVGEPLENLRRPWIVRTSRALVYE